jgi:hypothetical protein
VGATLPAMSLTAIHAWVLGWAIVGGWGVVAFWSMGLRLLGWEDTPVFWRAVSFVQILLVVQFLVGAVLLLLHLAGARSGLPGGGHWLWDVTFHFLYGFGFPVVVLVFAHKWARERRWNPHAVFAVAGLVIFGLTLRGWMLGMFGA